MAESSTGTTEFIRAAEELQGKVADIGTADAMGLAREARELVETFKSWSRKRPEDSARIAAIQRLMELNRRVMDYLAQRQKATRRPPS